MNDSDIKRYSRQMITSGWSLKRQLAIKSSVVVTDFNSPYLTWYALALGFEMFCRSDDFREPEFFLESYKSFNPACRALTQDDIVDNNLSCVIFSEKINEPEMIPAQLKSLASMLINIDGTSRVISRFTLPDQQFSKTKNIMIPAHIPIDMYLGIYMIQIYLDESL